MIIMPDLYVWWWRGCFLTKCFKTPLVCSCLRSFSTANQSLYRVRRGNSKRSSRRLCHVFKEILFTQVS